jgi:gamma-glutamyltranspeptidase / glutathione hydrolase
VIQYDDGTVLAEHGMVCTVDRLASRAGVDALRAGGSAVDAAIAANAVLAVTCQQMCGLGGDLLALVQQGVGRPAAVIAVGPAGSGADAAALRAEGHRAVPRYGDIRAVTVPGCVDGWIALHERYARLPLGDLLAPAWELATSGFPASRSLATAVRRIRDVELADDYRRPGGLRPGETVRRPLVAATLAAITDGGRDGFYDGDFGRGLMALGWGRGGRRVQHAGERSIAGPSGSDRSEIHLPRNGLSVPHASRPHPRQRDLFEPDDLRTPIARWVEPIGRRAWGHDVWTVPPPSQGYLVPASAWIAQDLDVPADPADPVWPHLLAEASRWAAFDRPEVLFDGADGEPLLSDARLAPRRAAIRPDRRTAPPSPAAPGGTTYLCAADDSGLAVSLIQSNAAGWGAGIVVPGTGVFLQNRGLGFSLEPGHPAELRPGRRPPHTLAPALVTAPAGELVALVGTMGGDTQPQIVLQLLARLLAGHATPGTAVSASRWFLGEGGFDTWTGDGPQQIVLEPGAPDGWAPGLASRGHQVGLAEARTAGHAQVLVRRPDGRLAGAADPRIETGAALGW